MAETRNMFLQARMNKDVDERIIPNGEYRDAQNIAVNRSEGADVGALENIKGNELVQTITPAGHAAIGLFMDESNDCMYVFTTDYSGTVLAPASSNCAIYRYVPGSPTTSVLVSGSFLNFSTLSPVYGISMLENLLFFTDNRNQPRVINVNTALNAPGYYTKEEHVSVAKFSPYLPISAVVEESKTVLTPGVNATTFTIAGIDNTIAVGDYAVDESTEIANVLTPSFLGIVINVDKSDLTNTVITVDQDSGTAILASDIIKFSRTTMSDQSSDPSWKGDPDFLEDKFVRFSYRFKYADNEYSLMAPFTQVMFIPKQDGYFLGTGDHDPLVVPSPEPAKNENDAYKSTILSWMENKANNIELYIPFPSNNPLDDYKISAVDILYKESDALATKVMQTVPISDVTLDGSSMNYFKYTYQSKKPYKTLPSADTTRVSDKVPIRALAQDVVSNRVVYGNYVNRNNAPESIDYNIFVGEKDPAKSPFTAQYPNHSLKQNRNYEVGIVLYDKFGRASSVLLSTIIAGINAADPTSTIYHAYKDDPFDPLNWYGDTLQIRFNSPIQETPTQSYIGTYGLPFSFTLQYPANTTAITTVAPYTYTITGGDFTDLLSEFNSNGLNNYLRGYNIDFTKIISSTFTGVDTIVVTEDRISDIYNFTGGYGSSTSEPKYVYTINPLGWYSYKVVVKQTEQDYYNAYLPAFLNGNPTGVSPDEIDTISNIVLIGDNINKIPRDLTEVGPDQQQYRSSSTRLYARVNNTIQNLVGSAPNPYTIQYYPGRNNFIATTIGSEQELYNNDTTGGYVSFEGFYQTQSNPLIARLSTDTSIGITEADRSGANLPRLSILETEPVTSLLDIYWETSTGGLIADLNELINQDAVGITGLSPSPTNTADFIESTDYTGGVAIADPFNLLDELGNPVAAASSQGIITQVLNGNGADVTSQLWFELALNSSSALDIYTLKSVENFVYGINSYIADVYDITMRFTYNNATTDITVTIPLQNATCDIGLFPTQGTFDNPGLFLPVNSTLAYTFQNLENGATTALNLNPDRLEGLEFQITGQAKQETELSPLIPVNVFTPGSITTLGTLNLNCSNLDKTTYKVDYRLIDALGNTGFTSDPKTVWIGITSDSPYLSTTLGGTAEFLPPTGSFTNPNDNFTDGITTWARRSGFAYNTTTENWSVCNSSQTEGVQVTQITLNNLAGTLPTGETSFRLAMEIVTPTPKDVNGNEDQFNLSTLNNKTDIKWQFFKDNGERCGTLGSEILATEDTNTARATLIFNESDLNLQDDFVITQLIRNIFTETEDNCQGEGFDDFMNAPEALKGQVYIKYTLAVNNDTLVPDPWDPGSELILQNTVRYIVNTMATDFSGNGLNNSTYITNEFSCTPSAPETCS